MNAWGGRSEIYMSKTGYATSAANKSSSEEKKLKLSAEGTANSGEKTPATKFVVVESKGPWTDKEHCAFVDGLYQYGIDWERIAVHVHSRNIEEVQSHFYSFQKEEPFLFRLRKMLDDKSLEKIIAWHPDTHGRSFIVYNHACIKVAIPLYFGAYFRDFDCFQRELYSYGFSLDLSRSSFGAGVWFHPQFLRDSPLELKKQALQTRVCNYQLCKKAGDLMLCTGCKNVHYCSLTCQQSDWNAHMWVCGKDMSGNEKSNDTGTDTSTSNMIGVSTKAGPDKTGQSKAKASTTMDTQKPLKEDVNMNKGKSSSEELKGQALQSRVCNNSLCHKTKNLRQCTGCHNVHYCSLVCQQADWRFHMLVCSKSTSGNDKQISTGTSTSNNTHDKNTQVIPVKSIANASTTTETPKSLKHDIETNTGAWSTTEHCRFLEGLEQYGRSWKDIASQMKTRTAEQVSKHGSHHLKKIDCYWTSKEHKLFLEGLEKYGKGCWVMIGSHIGTKNNEQVSFHAEEYFEEMNEESQKIDGSEDSSSDYEDSSQSKAKSKPRKPFATNVGEWSAGEHRRFVEGYKQHGRSWKDVASHVKTRTSNQVRDHSRYYLNKLDCFWTTKEHLLFIKGLEQYGRGHWEEIAIHVGTKNNKQVSFHAKEYFREKEINEKPQTTEESNEEEDSPATKEVANKPNRVLFAGDWSNTKRNRDQEKTPSESFKKIKTNEQSKYDNDEHGIVTPEKDTEDKGDMQNESTSSLKPSHQKTTNSRNGDEATYNHHNHENEILSPCSPARDNNDLRPIRHKTKKKTAITFDVHDTSCPVCLEKLNDPHIVPECCHRFCKGCIEEALEYRRECPICRGRVTSRRSLRRDEVFGKLLCLLDVERAKANGNSVPKIPNKNDDELSNDAAAAAADNHQTETGEKDEIINTNISSTIDNKNVDELSNDTIATDSHQTKTGEKYEIIDAAKSMKGACLQQKEQTQIQTEEEQNMRDETIEGKAHGDAVKDQLQHDARASEYLETQLEGKSTRINTLQNSIRSLSACGMVASAQLREKNDKIQHLESRQKADEERLENLTKTIETLEAKLESKNTAIRALEQARTLSDGNKLESMAVAVKDLQSQLQEKDFRIQHLESRLNADDENHRKIAAQGSSHLKTQLEEKNSRIKTLENQVRTLSEEHKVESTAASAQLQEKNDKIQLLEARLKVDKGKLQDASKANEQLETELEEKNTKISTLENAVRALTDMKKLESMDSAINDLRSQLENKNYRIQFLESRQRTDEEKLEQYGKTRHHLQTQLEEQNTRIKSLENSVRTLSEIKKLESMVAAASDPKTQLQEKIDRIQFLESRQENVEEKLRQMTEFVLCLSKKLEEGK